MGDLSEHFDSSEFACRCGCGASKTDPALIEVLERIRALAFTGGLRINSGRRCKRHNRAVGGATSSQHLVGKAADIPARITLAQARACGARGVGVEDATGLVVHVDVGPVRSWRYDEHGRVIP